MNIEEGMRREQEIRRGILRRGRLTKKFFLGLPDGAYLVSNCGVVDDVQNLTETVQMQLVRPIFAEEVMPEPDRTEQWQRIVECGADQRLCEVFNSIKEYERHLNLRGNSWSKLVDGKVVERHVSGEQLLKAASMCKPSKKKNA